MTKKIDGDEWHTPPEVIEVIREALGGTIDLDPASSAHANEIVKAKYIFGKEENGLEQLWTCSNLFMNPPFSRELVKAFCEKFLSEYNNGAFRRAIVLVNSSTASSWWQRYAEAADLICFPNKRIQFLHPELAEGENKNRNLYQQTIFIFDKGFIRTAGTVEWGDRYRYYKNTFSALGVVR